MGDLPRQCRDHGGHQVRERVGVSGRWRVGLAAARTAEVVVRGTSNSVAAPLVAFFTIDAIDAVHWHRLGQIGAYFAYAGSFVFGSGLAIVPFLSGGVVQDYHWLTEQQFVDAVAVAMIAPGAMVVAVATFVPCYLLTILPAPHFKKHGKRPSIVAFVDGVTAAAIGAIAWAVIVIGQRSITDWVTAALALVIVGVLWRFKKLPEPVVVLVAALIGSAVYPLLTHS